MTTTARTDRLPTVSVVVPCYNYGRFLPAAVRSALDQSGVEVDVLVVDDASTDDSAEVAAALAAADPRVSVLVHETNAGHIQTYNDGLARAKGEYVALLSADDLLTPDSLSRSVALMEQHPEVGLTYGPVATFVDQPPPLAPVRATWTVWEGEEWLRRVCRRGRNTIVNPEALMRTSVLRRIGGYDPAHPHAADLNLWLRAATIARIGRVNGPVQACYREHGGNMHRTRFAGVLTDLRESRRVFDEVLDHLFAEGRDVEADLWATARTALAREALLVTARAQADGDPENSAEELLAVAAECWPPVTRSARWRACRRRQRGGLRRGERRFLLAVDDVRWRVRWRRWRRWGT